MSLSIAQLTGRSSLRDIVSSVSSQSKKLYHLGASKVTKSTLARVNENQAYTLFEEIFNKLLTRCQGVGSKHKFRFKNKLYSLDASTIDLCLSVFPWVKFRSTKRAIKLHVGLDHDGYLLTFVTVTEGKSHDVTIGRTMKLPKGSIVVFDRGYNDYK